MEEVLTFELSGDGDDKQELIIFGNKEGFERLIDRIQKVIKYNIHDHLMTPSWSGYELSEEPQGKNTKILNQVTIVKLKDE